jgi:hypothetical protein
MTGLSDIGTNLQASGDIAATNTIWSQNEACLTTYDAYTEAEGNTALNRKASDSDVYTITSTYSRIEDALYAGNIDSSVEPLRLSYILPIGKWELKTDPTKNLTMYNITASGELQFASSASANALNITTDLNRNTLTCQSLYGNVIAQLKPNILSTPSITGDATASGNSKISRALVVAGNSTFSGDTTVSGSRFQVATSLTNTQVDGFNNSYFGNTITGATPTKTCQIFSGQGGFEFVCKHFPPNSRCRPTRSAYNTVHRKLWKRT